MMRRVVGIALLPFAIINNESSVAALSVRSPLHMTNGDKSGPSSTRSIPSTSVLATSTAPSPVGAYFISQFNMGKNVDI